MIPWTKKKRDVRFRWTSDTNFEKKNKRNKGGEKKKKRVKGTLAMMIHDIV